MISPKLLCLFLVSILLYTTAGCSDQTQQPESSVSSEIVSSQLESSSTPAPAYAMGGRLPEGYTLDVSGFDPVINHSDGRNQSTAYEIDFLDACYHGYPYDHKRIPDATSITARFGLDPTGATTHPMMLFSAHEKSIAEQTGKLKIDETIYTRAELADYLVYSDSLYEIYQIQALICGQPFPDCWEQLMQFAKDMRKDPDCKWPDHPVNMEHNQHILDAYVYFSEHIAELIVPPDANAVSEISNN